MPLLARVADHRAEREPRADARPRGGPFQNITHPDDLDVDLELAGRLLRGEIPSYRLEKRYIWKDGAIVQIELTGSILRDAEGRPLHYVAHVVDVTERKRGEEELRKSEERLARAQHAAHVGSFEWNLRRKTMHRSAELCALFGLGPDAAARAPWSLVTMFHLRQPLNAMLLNAQVAARVLSRSASAIEDAERAIDTIRRAAGRLHRMIDGLLDLSRLEARRLVLSPRSIDLYPLVADVVEPIAAGAPDRVIAVRVAPDLPRVDVDPERIAQVLENLLTNAVKYGAPGTPIDVGVAREGDRVVVAVHRARARRGARG